ncbi:hypothetical protein JVU11DRAFT_9310 [Chiua virens]|nr:hypothetical protein JVU11DRAFT_9310 [Chiua virens]
MHTTLGQVQAKLGFAGAGSEDPVMLGRPCGHIFTNGEGCFRSKDRALDESCVLRCFRASSHRDHNVSFFIAEQSAVVATAVMPKPSIAISSVHSILSSKIQIAPSMLPLLLLT